MSPDRRWDDETRKRLEDIAAHYQEFTRKISAIMWSLLLVVAVGGVVFTVLLNDNSDRIRDAKHLAVRVEQQTMLIQGQRFQACLDANTHHDQVIATTNELLRRLPADQRRRAQQNARSTLLFVNALAPKRDCSKFAPKLK